MTSKLGLFASPNTIPTTISCGGNKESPPSMAGNKLKKFFYLISILMASEILDQLTDLEKNVDSEVTKPKRGRKKKTDTKINEVEENDVRDKRDRLREID